MAFIDVDIVIPAREGKSPRPARPARVRLPVLEDPVLAATIETRYRGQHPIHHFDGHFYAHVLRRGDGLPMQIGTLFERRYRESELTESDLPTLGERLAAMDGQLMQRIHEPVWLVETVDTGGRMNTRDNAKQGVSVRLSCTLDHYPLQTFQARPIPPSGSPCAAFRADRGIEAERLVAPVAADTAWGQSGHHGYERLALHRPDLFVADDRAISLALLGPMLLGLGHAICEHLSRAGIERWIELRRLIGADGPRAESDYARIQDVAAGLLREARGMAHERRETDVLFKRTRNCAAMLVHRLDADNRHEPDADPDFDAFVPAP